MKICTKLLSIQCILKVQGFTVISYPQKSKCCKSAGFSGLISCKISKFPAGNARPPAGEITPCLALPYHNERRSVITLKYSRLVCKSHSVFENPCT